MSVSPPNEKQFVALARIAVAVTRDDQMALAHELQLAVELGLSEEALYEAVLQLVSYCGYPRVVHGMITYNTTFPVAAARHEGPPSEPWMQSALQWPLRGEQVFQSLWGTEALVSRRMDKLSPELAEWLLVDTFGRIFGRDALTLLQREAVVIGSLVGQGSMKELPTHRRAILNLKGHESLMEMAILGVTDMLPPEYDLKAREALTRMMGSTLEMHG